MGTHLIPTQHSGGYLDSESTIFLGVACTDLNEMVLKQISSRGVNSWQSLLDGVDTFTKDLVQVKVALISGTLIVFFQGGNNADR